MLEALQQPLATLNPLPHLHGTATLLLDEGSSEARGL